MDEPSTERDPDGTDGTDGTAGTAGPRPARPGTGWRGHFLPSRFRRGRLAAVVCLVYLGLVLAALVFGLVFGLVFAREGASLAGVWLIVVTMPLSLVVLTALAPLLDVAARPGVAAEWAALAGIVAILVTVLAGVLQAVLLWFLLRGRPRDAVPPSETAPTAP